MVTTSADQTQKLAYHLAQTHQKGVILLQGELGSGKTTFAQGFAKGLGINSPITSPTFVITKRYPIPDQTRYFYHIDLYRIENPLSLDQLGLDEIFEDDQNAVLIEWPERLVNLPTHTLVKIKAKSKNKREIIISDPAV